jgi:hypothetical protein
LLAAAVAALPQISTRYARETEIQDTNMAEVVAEQQPIVEMQVRVHPVQYI